MAIATLAPQISASTAKNEPVPISLHEIAHNIAIWQQNTTTAMRMKNWRIGIRYLAFIHYDPIIFTSAHLYEQPAQHGAQR